MKCQYFDRYHLLVDFWISLLGKILPVDIQTIVINSAQFYTARLLEMFDIQVQWSKVVRYCSFFAIY